MKHFYTLILSIAFVSVNAQSFYKGALVVDAGGGLDIYNTKVFVHNKINNRDTIETDKTGSTHFTFGAEYGLHKRFSAGIRFKSNNYFTEKDTATNVKPTLKSNDILVQLNYHPVSTKVFDLILGTDIGYTGMKWDVKDKEATKITAAGISYSFYINPRLYIGPFGFNMKLGLPFFNYPHLNSNNENFNKTADYKITGHPGFSLSGGIQFRFIKNKDKDESKKD